jgi:hypothetical protein
VYSRSVWELKQRGNHHVKATTKAGQRDKPVRCAVSPRLGCEYQPKQRRILYPSALQEKTTLGEPTKGNLPAKKEEGGTFREDSQLRIPAKAEKETVS